MVCSNIGPAPGGFVPSSDLTPLYMSDAQMAQLLHPAQDPLSNLAAPANLPAMYAALYAQQANQQNQPPGYKHGGRTWDPSLDPLYRATSSSLDDTASMTRAILSTPSIMKNYDVERPAPDAPPHKPTAPDTQDTGDLLRQYDDTPEGHQYMHDLANMQHKAKGGLLVNTEPSDKQKEAGNYLKGHVKVHGMHVSIENPKGSERKGRGRDGKEWKVKMPVHYGYIRNTEGADGDHVDVSLGDHHDAEHVHVIDQIDPDSRKFDEHKAMLGFQHAGDAVRAYRSSFSDGRGHERIGSITPMHVDKFKEWVGTRHAKKPLGDHFRKGGKVKSIISRFCDDSTIDAMRNVHSG